MGRPLARPLLVAGRAGTSRSGAPATPIRGAALVVFLFCLTSFGIVVILGGGSVTTVEVEVWYLTTRLFRLDAGAVLALAQLVLVVVVLWAYERTRDRRRSGGGAIVGRTPPTTRLRRRVGARRGERRRADVARRGAVGRAGGPVAPRRRRLGPRPLRGPLPEREPRRVVVTRHRVARHVDAHRPRSRRCWRSSWRCPPPTRSRRVARRRVCSTSC